MASHMACSMESVSEVALELELQAVVGYSIWVLGREPWSTGRIALNSWAISPATYTSFNDVLLLMRIYLLFKLKT